MSYTTEHITRTLKQARVFHSLSQRALSIKAGIPQSHISKIENGAVDLRLSSVVELAHVLGLEVMLVPRKSIPAVQTLVRITDGTGNERTPTVPKVLSRLQDRIARLLQKYPELPELAQMHRQVNELVNLQIPGSSHAVIRTVEGLVEEYSLDTTRTVSLRAAFERIRRLRNELVRGVADPGEDQRVRPAYSLDDDEDG